MSACIPCSTNAEHGHHGLGSKWTHCRDCHITWPSSNLWGHCATCHNTFAGSTAFDRHHMTGLCATLVSAPTPTKEIPPGAHSARMEPGGGKRYLELVEVEWGWAWQWDGSRKVAA